VIPAASTDDAAPNAESKEREGMATTRGGASETAQVVLSGPPAATDQPDEQDLQLGARIRQLRKAKRVTLRDAATAASVSESFLSQVERGLANPSVASLRRIADALEQPIATLFLGSEPEGMVVRFAERRRLTHPGGAFEDSLVTSSAARKLQIHQTVISPGGSPGDEPYTHSADEECVIVLEGALLMTAGENTVRLEQGDSMVLDPRQGHRFDNPLDTPTTVLWVMTPGNNY
jgi:transcriptional regulator with XRE-family HTH domain